MTDSENRRYPEYKSPGSTPGGMGAAPKGPMVSGTGVGFPQAHRSHYPEHGADLYNEDNGVFPTCHCGWEVAKVSTYDEAAEAYAQHRLGTRNTACERTDEITLAPFYTVDHYGNWYRIEHGDVSIDTPTVVTLVPVKTPAGSDES